MGKTKLTALNIKSWNANRLKTKKNTLELHLQEHNIDVTAIQETWLKGEDTFRIRKNKSTEEIAHMEETNRRNSKESKGPTEHDQRA